MVKAVTTFVQPQWTRRSIVTAAPALVGLLPASGAATAGANVMSNDEAESRAAIERYTAAWSSGNLEAITACYHPDFTLHYFGRSALSGDHVGKAAALKTLAEFSRRTRRQLVSIVATMAGAGRAAIVVREAMGVKRVEVERLLVYTIEDGLLRECWVYDQDQRLIDELVQPG
jgi:uncharacterized protein